MVVWFGCLSASKRAWAVAVPSSSVFPLTCASADPLAMMFAPSSVSSVSSALSVPLVSPGLLPARSSGAPSAVSEDAAPDGAAPIDASVQCARTAALAALREADPVIKAAAARGLYDAVREGRASCAAHLELVEPADLPGRPARPELVDPRQLKRRSMQSPQGRAVLLHALAHIEFNAINLALDAVWRFSGMPAAFYVDWLKVAAEEAYHFSLLSVRLAEYGHAYGDFPAHDGLWDMCERTRGDVLARMALVPRTLEARGLDASPPIRARLQQAGDQASAAILDVILRD
ncbi:uncharacterized ferritin-like protein (DUF455 family) [Paraburkholderia bryophila]|uniref:Uncharacterized ferritin-like protein (DUF455 family) n=1 Tax=Paraburkholderia bryophila TaxID=420952 RepID=A0A329CXI9_9BURK|nr:uncharacterized ferritin-like protein (DUF455 family) [Paraburkholderia bryophila]